MASHALLAIVSHWIGSFLASGFLMQVLTLLQLALTVWMLVDAYRRGAMPYWYFIILLLFPIGTWVYFFVYKAQELPQLSFVSNWLARQSRPSLEELQFRVQQTPTFANQVALAERLIEKDQPEQAITLLDAALKREPEHGQVLFDLAKCQRAIGQPGQAIPYLQKIIKKDRQWSNYAAWLLLIDVHRDAGDAAGALATARDLANLTQSLQHRCLLVEQLIANGQRDEARQLLQTALAEHQFTPGPFRRRNRPWARQAKKLLKQVG